ncbi:helix-turn-helix domain-containing protein [Nocardia farcinica]|uniref:helix-turn-helix domain-containing protein n=1 Tax=Nocardia farcinica TaxID=37329 RepID=UPI002456E099|nr:helix-turn-helix domain-containing protein [Nocardia farcinica]
MPNPIPTPSRHIHTSFKPKGRKHAKYEMRTTLAGLPGYVPSAPVREHVHLLHDDFGLPLASIARDAQVHYSCIQNINLGVSETTRIRHARAIMAVTHTPNQRQQIVLAIGAARRLHALQAIGWTFPAIANEMGYARDALYRISRYRFTAWETWAAVHDVYEKLSGTPCTTGRHRLARNLAERDGHPAPLDWEGLDIDDPRVMAVPSRTTVPSRAERTAALRETVAELRAEGLAPVQIGQRMGLHPRTIERAIVEDRHAAAS